MSMQIKPGYTNPLTMMEHNRANRLSGLQAIKKPDDSSTKVTSLHNKQQQLHNEMLLIKATGADTGQNATEKLKNMEEKLAEVSDDLRTAKTDSYAVSAQSQREQLWGYHSRTWRA